MLTTSMAATRITTTTMAMITSAVMPYSIPAGPGRRNIRTTAHQSLPWPFSPCRPRGGGGAAVVGVDVDVVVRTTVGCVDVAPTRASAASTACTADTTFAARALLIL